MQWSQKKIVDRIKRKAAALAEAKVDTVMNHGFHIRFDFSNYFGQLHGYLSNVCDELHQYNIKFMDHYSCNHVERPRGEADFRKLHKEQRHHILLFHDSVAAEHAQYEGYYFNDLCEVDIRDGRRGYSEQYQMEAFCHNNPDFLDMHFKYLKRLIKDVAFDGFQVDDMCDYAGLTTCGCKYCRERFRRDYGREIPAFDNKSFWGDTSKPMIYWGNYENPAFRDFLRMKTDGIVDHVKMVKSAVGTLPIMTCCSSTGPIALNAISLDLEKMASIVDFFMLENVGTNVSGVNWIRMDAEALHQKDMAKKRGNAPTIALSSTIYKKGAYLGWSLSRFWGVSNWCSTLQKRLEEDPVDAMETEEVVDPIYNWNVKYSDLNYMEGEEIVEVRLVSNRFCRDNGWRDEKGNEHWDRLKAWSASLVKNNIGYRFVRTDELADLTMLNSEMTPLILDGVACVSDRQFEAIASYAANGGIVWLSLPFGTHDEKGFKRTSYLSEKLLKSKYKNLTLIDSAINSEPIEQLLKSGTFKPIIKQIAGDPRWALRVRVHKGKPVIHFMNTALIGIPHPTIKDRRGIPILSDIESQIEDNRLTYEINSVQLQLSGLKLLSPELGDIARPVLIEKNANGGSSIHVNLDKVKVYAVVHG